MKIIVFTGSRAELFLQLPLWVVLKKKYNASINVIISYSDIETKLLMEENLKNEKLDILKKINLIEVDNSHSVRISRVLSEINKLNFDNFRFGIVFADRYESFGFAIAISQIGLPLIHIEAGDITMGGTFDDNVRHSISALSSLFITTNQKAQNYLLKNDIKSSRIINCGIFTGENYFKIISDNEIINKYHLKDKNYDFIVVFTYHPLSSFIEGQIKELNQIHQAFKNLSERFNMRIIITGVNADIGGEYVSKFIMKFKSFNADVSFHSTLGAKNYLALMNYGKNEKVLVIGNSSSIVKEVPFFKCVGVLIGGRQKGRELANNTIQIDADSNMIMSCIDNCIFNYEKIISQDNPYYVKDSVNKAAEFIYKVFSANTNEIIKNIYEELKYE